MKIKKIIAGAVACCIVCGGLPVIQGGFPESAITANAEENTYGDLTYWVKDDGTVEIKSCSKDAVSVEIPSEIDGKKVTSMSKGAFQDCTELESVVIQYGVKSLWDCAFDGCTNLKNIQIPDSVTSIDWATFRNCINLESIVLPDSIEFIGGEWGIGLVGIGECPFINTAILNNQKGVYYADKWIILSDKDTTEFKIKDNTIGIAVGAFVENENISEIVIPESVEHINFSAFCSYEKLKSLTILNPECDIQDEAINFNGTIYGYEGSTAQKYVEEYDNGYPYEMSFESLGAAPGKEPVCGDTNNDGFINAIDASLVLSEYASVSTGGTPVSEGAAAYDVNKDGFIDAKDASNILEYYSFISTTNEETGGIISWLESGK